MATHLLTSSTDQRQMGWIYPVTGVAVVVLLLATLQLQFRSLQLQRGNSSCSSCCAKSNRTVIKLQYENEQQQNEHTSSINSSSGQQRPQQQQQQHQQSEPGLVGDWQRDAVKFDAASSQQYCSMQFPWIEDVVKEWFKPAYASAKQSKQNSSEALQSIKDVRWGDYHPGMEEVTLKYNSKTQGTDMSVHRVSKPNQPWKPVGMLAVLQRAVATHSAALAAALKDSPTKEVRLIIETEDFPLVYRSAKWKLPAFAMCASPDHIDIPVPDFTFEEYPEAGYANSSWAQISALLQLKGTLVPWKLKQANLFMRQNKGVGYRKTLMPVLETLQEEGKDTEVLGVPLDVADTGFMVSHRPKFVLLDEWCNHRYQIHTSGFSYSASLKYKMACGTVVFNFMSPNWREFYYPALQDGVQFINFNETDAAGLSNNVLPQIKTHIDKVQSGGDAEPQLAASARDWVRHNLSNQALSCYWYRVLLLYIRLYAASGPAEVSDR